MYFLPTLDFPKACSPKNLYIYIYMFKSIMSFAEAFSKTVSGNENVQLQDIFLEFSREGDETSNVICEFKPMLQYQEPVIHLAHMNYLFQAKLATTTRQSVLLIVSAAQPLRKTKDEIELAFQVKTQAVLCLLLF